MKITVTRKDEGALPVVIGTHTTFSAAVGQLEKAATTSDRWPNGSRRLPVWINWTGYQASVSTPDYRGGTTLFEAYRVR
jgi:hypothetical protein